MSATPPRIVIAAGGTAGHVVPALAVADALRARGAEVTFIGGERAEAQLVPAAGYPLHTIAVAGLDRGNPLRAARALALAVKAFLRARALLGELRPDAVMGGGGYVSGPVGLAAVTRRIPLVLTEADSHLGLANRALAPFARRVCLAFAIDGRDGRRYRVTGRPIPPPHEDRAGGAGAAGDRAGRDLRAGVRRLAGRALDQPRRDRGVRGRRLPRAARLRAARPPGARGAAAPAGV